MQRPHYQRPPAAAASRRRIHVYDHRSETRTSQRKVLETGGLDINGFRRLLSKEFSLSGNESYELVTTDRIIVDFDKFNEIKDDVTLYLVRNRHQQLAGATEEPISYTPHFHTLTEAGTYEYHASEGNKALPFALAELIDNSLSATSKNKRTRTIEIRMMFDATMGKPALIVLDNGCGMTSKKLSNWAVYKLSKFTREDGVFSSHQEHYVRPAAVRRSLNSDISYFGVGGKQAIFFIGKSVRMITKSPQSPDVRELVLSEEEFKRREANKEDIFSGVIKNRAPGDSSLVQQNERFLRDLIAEERGKESFTAVVITGLQEDHVAFMTNEFKVLTRQLAHIYHYYIHGPDGNVMGDQSTCSDQHNDIDIQVTLREKPPKIPRAINLREVEDDMQTLYINSAADTFEFKASTNLGDANLEGLIRYHPFLFDRETYPEDPNAEQASTDDEDDLQNGGRGKKAIFECFWNGRLIPSTTISEFDWCSWSSKRSNGPPAECYNRLSGVLFTDDGFKVTQNKLTFMDLELKVKNKDMIFTTFSKGQKTAKRADIQKEFNQWLLNCHRVYDKQVKFIGLKETLERQDPKKKMVDHWTTFSAIEWDGRKLREGDRVKSCRTQPICYGTVVHFLLRGKYSGDVVGAGGHVEIIREPKSLYGENKDFPISKIDRGSTAATIATYIDNELLKFPKELKIEWPEGDPWPNNDTRSAGSSLGPLKITILNGKGESINQIPSGSNGGRTTLNVQFSLVHHSPRANETKHVAHYSAKHGFWFTRKGMVQLGKYTLSLNAIVSENGSTEFKGTKLPSHVLKFTITAGVGEMFSMETFNTPARVGVPFDIPLQIKDRYGHAAEPPLQLEPVLTCSELELSYTAVISNGSRVTIQGVKAAGKIVNHQGSFEVNVSLPGLKKDTESIKINLRPGLPHSIYVTPKEEPIRVENRTPIMFNVQVHDQAGNVTTNPRQTVRCQVPDCRPQTIDCSGTGAGQLQTKPINLTIIREESQTLQVSFDMPNHKAVSPVTRELLVFPSTQVTAIELYVHNDDNLDLKPNEKIRWLAGGLLENLVYKLFDEAGRNVAVTPEIASKIKVSWTDVNMEDLMQGKLPDLQVPKQVQDERWCQVFYQEHNVSFSFTVVPHPDEPTKLKVTLPQNVVKLGETLSGDICLELVDKYDNATKSLTQTCSNQMNVKAEGLDKSAITFTWQESSSSVTVSGVRFEADAPGPREMTFTYQSFVEQVIIRVTAGDPAKLTLVSAPRQPLQLLSGTGSSTPFVVQLCDEWGNPSDDQTVEIKIKSTPPSLKVTISETSHHVNAEGKASFIVDSVSGPKGLYQLMFQGSCNNRLITSPSVNLTVIPDPRKPVKLSVEYDKTARFLAGRLFPVFSVTVVSEEGSPITSIEPAALSMKMWESESSGNAPEDAIEMKCSRPLENDRKDSYHFREKDIPVRTGRYTIQFSLRINNSELLFSDQVSVDVVSDQPVKLRPAAEIPEPVVSSTEDIANRTLVENMTLLIMDSHGNPAGQELSGKVVVSIISAHAERNGSLPLFEGSVNRTHFKLVNGKAHIPKLAIMKNSQGENGRSYVLRFHAELSVSLAPFRLNFLFSSDVQKQRMMSELTKRKAELTSALATYNEYLSTFTELLDMLKFHYNAESQKEAEARAELENKNITLPQPVSTSTIDAMIREKTAEAERVQRRTCNIADPFKGRQDVLGKVGHLAQLQDDDAARVISWNLGSHLDCVVTRTTEAAQKIDRDTQGKQQVWPLDSMSVSQTNRPLPHIQRGRTLFDPPGNPVLARELLIYPQHEQSCKIVFQNLLKDTILIDDLNSANQYRRMVVQKKIYCPTILTRQGERVNAIGIFGGAQNKAPPMDRLKVFAAPFPENYHAIEEQKNLLTQYRSALLKKEEAERELKQHLANNTGDKQQEMKKKKKELEEIDSQLASLQAKPAKRSLQDEPESSGISAKQAKM